MPTGRSPSADGSERLAACPVVLDQVAANDRAGPAAPAFAVALGLPSDYFPEVREAAVVALVRRSPRLREAIYSAHIKKPSK